MVDDKFLLEKLINLYWDNLENGESLFTTKDQLLNEKQPSVYGKKWIEFHEKFMYSRPKWLNRLPPFNTETSQSGVSEILYYKFIYFSKLQGLLTCPSISQQLLASLVQTLILARLQSQKQLTTHLVLQVLSLPLVDKYFRKWILFVPFFTIFFF